MEERVTLRPRRQVTLPRSVCEALGVKPGDRLVLEVSDGVLIARPQRQLALEALQALRQSFAESGIPLEEFLESGRQIREELFWEKYGHLVRDRDRPPKSTPEGHHRGA